MGPLEDDENCHNNNDSRKNDFDVDLSDFETQQIDSQFSPGGFFEDDGANDSSFITNTVPVDDTYLLEDAFETQLVNLAGETQVVDLAGEAQVVDPAGETQVVDPAGETQVLDDLDCMNNMPNDFNADIGALNEFDLKHKAACETQEFSQDDPWRTDSSVSVGPGSKVNNYHPKQGSVCRGFTSIRTASIRASGLAAHAQGAKRTSSDGSSVEQKTCEQDGSSLIGRKNDQECLQNEYDEYCGEMKNSNKCKIGGTAMRKLFREDKVAEDGQSEADDNHIGPLDMPELPAENCLAGLSYANSQEPGELSQAYALEVVDRFLDLNVMECDEGFGTRVHKAEKPKVVSVGKGSRDLAKSSTLKSADGEHGIYDWDDTREDDGGGDFFLKKKEIFFDKGGPKESFFTEPRKRSCSDLGSAKAVADDGDEKGDKYTRYKLGDSVYSDSGLHKLRAKRKSLYCGEKGFHKNLMKDLDEQVNMVPEPKLADNVAEKDVPDMSIGPDTQMAAEAMENLCFEVSLPDDDSNVPNKGAHSTRKATRKSQSSNKLAHSEHQTSKIPCPATVGVVTRQAKQIKTTSVNRTKESSLPQKQPKKLGKRRDTVLGEAEQSRLAHHGAESTGQRSEEKHQQPEFPESVAHRTRKCTELNRLKADANSSDAREEINDVIGAHVLRKRRTTAKDKNAVIVTIQQLRKVGSTGFKQLNKTCGGTAIASNTDSVDNPRGKRSNQEMFVGHEADTHYSGRLKRSRQVAAAISPKPGRKHPNHTSICNGPALSSSDESEKTFSHQNMDNESARNEAAECDSNHMNVKASLNDAVDASISNQHDKKNDAETSAKGTETNNRQEASPGERCRTSSCATPAAACATPMKNVSPICMGDEYHKQSCRKSLSRFSLIKELNNLVAATTGPSSEVKEPRKRKDITNVRVLFSQHLDLDVVKQQKKILARLGGAVVSSMSDATHFVADEFVRTRNMLEAIASGKPVVNRLWLESCGEASCLIDEKNYILRDAKKEREFGFSLPLSLSRACQYPLLQGQKVFITPNTKPGKDILANLVTAVHGLAVERLGRSALKDERLPDDLLILSCEEDYDICVPFLEKGGAVYSSELLLNGIVKQKLEYERHRLFADHVKRTRSTIWVKKKNRYHPVTRSK
ncbi:hypothetical protein CDL12_12997 [Handroanthus impetiginosus]|uniref:BRCT domain-containing protein n=1 Tax=Handroanthus impetiginosus TaxID=429701 RepID=A0A2G9HA20_9LAMI|nr:hypothetical protein CDL12_12997 [Handroanthus impetiginosus]